MKTITGGICAAKGYKAAGIHCGIRKNKSKKDLSLIISEKPASAAAVYTTNLVKGAPLLVTKKHISNGVAQAIICNSGNANTCNSNGIEIAEQTCKLVAEALQMDKTDIVVASTGVIGQPLDIAPIKAAIPSLVASLGDNSDAAAEGIMTTDTTKKEIAVEFELDGKTCRIGGIAKGSGMIHPDMATMLVFITTDCAISSEMLRKALSSDIKDTFNMVSVDGDTSTNDMVTVLANGMAGNIEINSEGDAFNIFMKALNTVTVSMGEPDEVWKERIDELSAYAVTKDIMAAASSNAVFMHCLPSYHDKKTEIGKEMCEKFGRDSMEVTDEVFESNSSVVFHEAENRMHTIKAVMAATLGGELI